jgi:hypothetical protein
MRLNVGKLEFKRTLKYVIGTHMRGDDVRAWQQFLGIVDDGDFGEHTDRSTRRMQRELGVTVDGAVGPATIAAANKYGTELESEETTQPDVPAPRAIPSVSSLVSAFKQATKYTRAARLPGDINLIVLHTAEIGESLAGAEALMKVCADPHARDASWHFAVDADSITQSVLVRDVAWHAPGANRTGIGIEMSGRARQTEQEWADDYSAKMLTRCAQLVASLCNEWRIPPVLITSPADLLDGKRGITTHALVSKAWKKSDHWDPGPNFPFDKFMGMVRTFLAPEA